MFMIISHSFVLLYFCFNKVVLIEECCEMYGPCHCCVTATEVAKITVKIIII